MKGFYNTSGSARANILDEVGDTGTDFPPTDGFPFEETEAEIDLGKIPMETDFTSTDAEPFEEAETVDDLDKIPMGNEIGCTDSTASNYNPNAILNDTDLCIFDEDDEEDTNYSIYLYGGLALVALLVVLKK